METPLGPYEKEYMKMAMLKHEETFKQQVYELHRLYRIQKILMKSIGSNIHAFGAGNNNNTSANSKSCSNMDNNKAVAILNYMKLQQQEEIRPAEESDIAEEAVIEESQVELTLGLGPASTANYYHNKSKKRGSTSDSIPSSFSSSSTGSTRSFDIHQHRDSESDGVVVVEAADRMKQYPPWIFQVLSLNST